MLMWKNASVTVIEGIRHYKLYKYEVTEVCLLPGSAPQWHVAERRRRQLFRR